MKTYPLAELLRIAKAQSPFYQDLFAGISEADFLSPDILARLPMVDQTGFWAASSATPNRLLTAPPANGVVFKSGGTTGNPKFSVFTQQEWETFTEIFGTGLVKGGLQSGEKVANLFYSGELYASFLFINKSIEKASQQTLQFPITGASEPATVTQILEDFQIDVIAGVPTSILTLADYLTRHEKRLPAVRKILFGGESMYPDQRIAVQAAFPGVRLSSIGYASVDAGLLGYVDPDCAPDEHRVFSQATVLELVDEDTGQLIHEVGHPGKLLITNLTRTLMPIIRYPAGDRAVWCEPVDQNPDRKFKLLGRSEESARVGPASVYYDDVRKVLSRFQDTLHMTAFQIIVLHVHGRDQLKIRIASSAPSAAHSDGAAAQEICQALLESRPMLKDLMDRALIHAPLIEQVSPHELEINSRTGKMRRILDLRHLGSEH